MTETHVDVRIPSGEIINTSRIKEGLWTVYEAARVLVGPSNHGANVVNLEMTGRLLWNWLSNGLSQDNLDFLGGKITGEGWNTISRPLKIDPKLLGGEEEFCREFTERLTRVPYQEALFGGAMDELEDMSERGPVRIWTVGDVRGIPDLNLRGSWEQLKKAARLKLNRIRRSDENKAKDKVFIDEGGQKRVIRHFDVSASEDKFAALTKIVEEFRLLGIKKVIVVDDKLTNTRKAKKRISEEDPTIKTIEVWDRESEGFENVDRERKTTAGLEEGSAIVVYDVRNIVENVLPILDKDEKVGWIVDMDDVALNDNVDGQLQTNAVLSLLRAKDIITAEY